MPKCRQKAFISTLMDGTLDAQSLHQGVQGSSLEPEDFCGSAALSCAWVEEHRENRAFGIDLDPEPLEWCRQNHFPKLTADQREAVENLMALLEPD